MWETEPGVLSLYRITEERWAMKSNGMRSQKHSPDPWRFYRGMDLRWVLRAVLCSSE